MQTNKIYCFAQPMTCLQRKEAQHKDLENLADAYYIYYVQV